MAPRAGFNPAETLEQIAELIRKGCTHKEIEAATGLSKTGVNYYVKKLLQRFGLYGIGDSHRLVVRLVEEKAGRMPA